MTAEFAEAAQEYGVPMELLMAIGYVNTRWEMPSPETNAYRRGDPHGWGSYGIMALVRNPFSDTLGEASRLTGIPEEELKVDRAANIRGGAALLASSAGGYASGDPSDFYGAVAGRGLALGQNYSAVSGIGGASSTPSRCSARCGPGLPRRSSPARRSPCRWAYPRPGWEASMVAKPPVAWYPADWSNYTPDYRGAGQIDRVVIHVTQGSYPSAVDWFQTPGSEVSAHYVVRSSDGQVAQCVDDSNIAWHAGTWPTNRRSIGIEHEGYFDDPTWFTARMYRSSARLVAYLCWWYGIPIDRRHIVGHYEVSYTECPGPWWWWDHYMGLVWRYAWR